MSNTGYPLLMIQVFDLYLQLNLTCDKMDTLGVETMIGIVIATHSDFAQGLKNACEMIAGKQESLEAVCFDGDEQLLDLGERIKAVSSGFDQCIYVVDMLNATPFNACLLAIAQTDNMIIAGASLPLLIELCIKRQGYEGTAEQLANEILESSKDYVAIRHSRDVFNG